MNSRLRWSLITLAAVVGVVVTVSLGRWQLSRAAQKEAMQAAMDAQGSKTPLDARALVAAPDASVLIYQHARLKGQWVQGSTVFLDNRQMVGRVGFFAVTPLRLEGLDAVVLVQRGWVPRNFEVRASVPQIETPSGVVEVPGRIAPPPSKLYEPGTPAGGAIRQNLDLAQFQTETRLPLMGVTLQQTGAPSEGLLRDWPAIHLGVDKHYGYAFQWFGLAALIAGLYLWFQIVRPYFLRPKDPAPHV